MNPVNPRIRRWLEAGHAVDVLIGRPGYFVRDLDYVEEHDRVLSVNQLLTWAEDTNSVERAARAIVQASEELSRDGDLSGAFSVLWTYVVVSEDRQVALPLSHKRLQSILQRLRTATHEVVPADLVDELERRLGSEPRSSEVGVSDEPEVER